MIISGTRRAFEMKQKAFFLVSQVLSFRHTKQTTKNVVDTSSKIHRNMIKQYNESDYNLQLRFLVLLRSLEGDRENTISFLLLFIFIFLPEKEDIVTSYNDKSY